MYTSLYSVIKHSAVSFTNSPGYHFDSKQCALAEHSSFSRWSSMPLHVYVSARKLVMFHSGGNELFSWSLISMLILLYFLVQNITACNRNELKGGKWKPHLCQSEGEGWGEGEQEKGWVIGVI